MKRYSMEIDISESSSLAKKVKVKEVNDENGRWVKYDDHLFELITAVDNSRGICKWKIGYGEVFPECGFKYSFDDEKWWYLQSVFGELKFCPYCSKQIKILTEDEVIKELMSKKENER